MIQVRRGISRKLKILRHGEETDNVSKMIFGYFQGAILSLEEDICSSRRKWPYK